ncbi:TonB-dependent receptor [Mariniflexile sp. HMF6888]|uniref:TonB-dependent receptor n=1 Tax=Mariniflexile sp. HMF6888 TaxID=3373086 RepID=UPI00379D6F5D
MLQQITTFKRLCFAILLFISGIAMAQNGSISGTVTDTNGAPLPGVNVLIQNTSKGSVTDFDGNYSISELANGNYVIEVSYIGFKKQQLPFIIKGGGVKLNVVLQEDLMSLSEVVVTGSGNPRKKIESSVAITTLGSKQIEDQAPQSTADLLQAIPGFLVETSGGETGNNLFARGIPTAGAYEYVQFQEDGMPVFEDGALQFANIDNFQRVDKTVKTLEAVKGGTAAIYASGAPGGIINFISNTGQNEFKGTTKLTVGDYGLFRTDFNLGGAFVEDKIFYNVGGFYRVDDGIRDPGYKANNGGQVKFNMTYKFDKGYARIYFKNLNDRTIFYQSTPFVKDGNKVKEYKGFDANYGTFANKEMAYINVPQGGGGFFTANLEDGIHPKTTAIGGEFKYDLSDVVTVKNSFKNTDIDLDYNAIFAAAWMGDVTSQNDYATGLGIDPADAVFTYNNGGSALPSNRNLKRADFWNIRKQMNNFANNLTFNFNWDKVNLNLGYYYSNWKSHQNWNWSSFLTSVEDEGRLVNLTDTNSGTDYTYHGISGISWLQRESQITGTVNAIFVDTEIKASDDLTLNLGFRYDNDKYEGIGDHGTWGNDIGVLPNNNADNGVNILTGNYINWDYKVSELSYSAAGNYKFNDNMATYLRYSKSFRAPIEEAFYVAVESGLGNAALDELEPTKVNQTELGFKYSADKIAVFANLFHMKLDNVTYQDIGVGGVSERKFANVKNTGIELETILKLGKLNATVNGTLQNPEYSGYEGSQAALNGNLARRISKFYFNVRPDYNITDKLNVYAKYSYFGKKYHDIENTFELPAFGVVNAGASYKVNNLRFGLDASNIFNTIGLTEGDGAAPANGDVFLGRSILGSAVKLSVAINF